MASYKFRITFEDYDDITRDIEIKSTQTFLDLHNCLQESIKFDNSKPASFFMSNDRWIKGTEISLNPKTLKDGTDVALMKTAVMNKYIYDPHQKIYYEFGEWCFFVELIKINTTDDKNPYPRCVKVNGEAPKQYKVVKAIPGVMELNNLELPEGEPEPDEDDIEEIETADAGIVEGIDEGETEIGFGIESDSEDEIPEEEIDENFGSDNEEI